MKSSEDNVPSVPAERQAGAAQEAERGQCPRGPSRAPSGSGTGTAQDARGPQIWHVARAAYCTLLFVGTCSVFAFGYIFKS